MSIQYQHESLIRETLDCALAHSLEPEPSGKFRFARAAFPVDHNRLQGSAP